MSGSILLIILKIFLIIVNISQENLIYNKKGMNRLLIVTILLALGNTIYIIPASILTIITMKETFKRKKIIKDIKLTVDNTRYTNIQSFVQHHNIDMKALIDILKKHSLKKSEINSSIIILSSCAFGLLFSPIVSMVLVIVSYLLSTITKGFVSVSLDKPYVHKQLIDNLELELRVGNEKYINQIISKYKN